MSNCKELSPVRSMPPQQPSENGAPVSRMELKPSENAWLPPAAALVSVIWSVPPVFASVALVLAPPKFRNQSCTPAGFQEYKTPGVCALALERDKLRPISVKKVINH